VHRLGKRGITSGDKQQNSKEYAGQVDYVLFEKLT